MDVTCHAFGALMFFGERMGVEVPRALNFMFDIGTLSEHVSWKSCEIFRDETFLCAMKS